MADRSALGRTGEDLAAAHLVRAGWTILARNVRTREGELDIVAVRADTIAFVEVKTRRSRAFGSPAEAVTARKARRIRGLAAAYLTQHRARAGRVRFDVIEVAGTGDRFRITHLEDAF